MSSGSNDNPVNRKHQIEEIEPISFDEKNRQKPIYEDTAEKQSWFLPAFFYSLLQQALEKLQFLAGKRSAQPAAKSDIRSSFRQLEDLLHTLMKEDKSQDTSFLNAFSTNWKTILEESLQLRSSTPLAQKINHFIQELEKPPKSQGQALGYYLTEYSNGNWLPFPFIELLKDLHNTHVSDPTSSLLTRWTILIEDLLNQE